MLNMWDPLTLQEYAVPTDVYHRSMSEDSPYDDIWWPEAIVQGILNIAASTDLGHGDGSTHVPGVYSNYTVFYNGSSGDTMLRMLSGQSASVTLMDPFANAYTVEAFWADLQKAQTTPMTVATFPEGYTVSPVAWEHTYAILWTNTAEDGSRSVVVQNPWKRTEELDLWALWWSVGALAHLDSWGPVE